MLGNYQILTLGRNQRQANHRGACCFRLSQRHPEQLPEVTGTSRGTLVEPTSPLTSGDGSTLDSNATDSLCSRPKFSSFL